jgi:hypothetical protein
MPFAVAAAVATVAGAAITSRGNRRAAQTQADAANNASALQDAQFQQTRQDNMPRINTGNAALARLSDYLGLTVPASENQDPTQGGVFNPVAPNANTGSLMRQFTGKDLQSDPGYQFGLDQGLRATNERLGAAGQRYGGAAIKAANRYANDYAGTKFSEAFNRDMADKNQRFNMLSGVAGTGQVASNQVSAAGQNNANQVGQNLIGAGDARASGYISQGNIFGNAINQGLSAYRNYSAPQQTYTPQQVYDANSYNVPQTPPVAPIAW